MLLAACGSDAAPTAAPAATATTAAPLPDGSVKGGISTATLQDGGVGLAPFHDWDGKISGELKWQIQKATEGIKDGSIKIDLP